MAKLAGLTLGASFAVLRSKHEAWTAAEPANAQAEPEGTYTVLEMVFINATNIMECRHNISTA